MDNSISKELYENRLLLLIEEQDFSGFRQVILTPEQFKRVSDAISTPIKLPTLTRNGLEVVEIKLDGKKVIPPEQFDGMTSFTP